MDGLLHFEDFSPGQIYDCGSCRVPKDEIFAFAREFDPQPHHLDEKAAQHSILKGLSASGWHVCAIGMKLFAEGLLARTAGRGSPGVEDCRWMKPMRPDDLVRLDVVVLETRGSKSRPNIGFVKFEWRLSNDREQIATLVAPVMVERRAA